MKNRSLMFMVASMLAMVIAVAGCSSKTATTSTTSVTTSSTATTTTPVTSSTAPVTSNTIAANLTLPIIAPAITYHNAAIIAYMTGSCLDCHGLGMLDQFPTAPSWNATTYNSLTHTGVYTIVAGSIQDHTGRTAAECITCHAAPTS